MDAREKIAAWKGGPLPVFAVARTMKPAGTNEDGETVYTRSLERRPIGEIDAVPFGEGLAIIAPGVSEDFEHELQLTFGIRNGTLQCTRIEPLSDGPELTQARLRVPLDKLVSEYAVHSTYRLEVDHSGSVVGVSLTSPRDPWDTRGWDEIAREDLAEQVRRPGRPRISEAELQHVAAVVREAKAAQQSIARAVAEEFFITPNAAKKRIKKARDRGLLPPPQRRNNG